jgi:hypothetical protein
MEARDAASLQELRELRQREREAALGSSVHGPL